MEHKLKATGGEAVTQRESWSRRMAKPSLHICFLNKNPLVTYLLLVSVPSILTWLGRVIQKKSPFFLIPDRWRSLTRPLEGSQITIPKRSPAELPGVQLYFIGAADNLGRLSKVKCCFWMFLEVNY